MRFEYTKGAKNSLPDAIQSIEAAKQIIMGKKRPALVDIRNLNSISRESRAYYAGEETSKVFLASAILIDTPVGKVIGNFFLGLNKPLIPTRIFTLEKDAIEWLKGFLI